MVKNRQCLILIFQNFTILTFKPDYRVAAEGKCSSQPNFQTLRYVIIQVTSV